MEMPPPGTIATACWHGHIALGNAATSPFAAGLHLVQHNRSPALICKEFDRAPTEQDACSAYDVGAHVSRTLGRDGGARRAARRHSGARATAREPGIYTHGPEVRDTVDSGLAPSARPGI